VKTAARAVGLVLLVASGIACARLTSVTILSVEPFALPEDAQRYLARVRSDEIAALFSAQAMPHVARSAA
jgi:hypothetical protein